MIVLELSETEAETVIRDLGRAIVLLDVSCKQSDDPVHQRACVGQTVALRDLWERFDGAMRGERAAVRR